VIHHRRQRDQSDAEPGKRVASRRAPAKRCRVKAACLAQLVNAIAPIMTEMGGPAWRQTIFYPFADFSNLGRGQVLKCEVDSPAYSANYCDPRGSTDLHFPIPETPFVKAAAVHSAAEKTLTLFLLNRHLEQEANIEVAAGGFSGLAVERATTLRHADLEAVNTKESPENVRPAPLNAVSVADRVRLNLPAASWNVVRLTVA
jgi:alpha-L-arabinofuranosidase